MYKPSYISGYKFGTGMKQQQKYPIKLHMTNKQLFFFVFFVFFEVEHIHPNAFAQILEGTFLAMMSHWSYSIKHYKKHIEFE